VLSPVPLIRRLLLPVKRRGLRAIRAALLRFARAAPAAEEGPPRRVFILLVSAWGMGGTIRAAINLAGHLASAREVEIVSTYRRRATPYFAFDARVTVSALDDQRPGAVPWTLRPVRALLRRFSSAIYHHADLRSGDHNLWTDLQLVRLLRRQRGVLIGTRPGLNMLAADLALPGLVTIGVEQMNLGAHKRALRRAMIARYPRLDGLAVLTEGDRREYERALDGTAPPMWCIPNTVRDITPPQADLTARRILAAGRLTSQKGFDLLIPAFAPVAAAHPDWELRICGRGVWHDRLAGLVRELGLEGHVTLAGPSEDVPGEMAAASIYALSSRYEGFPLVLIEAMSKGMAVVAFDCPTGPGEIVDSGVNGLLVPAMDVQAFSAALMRMVQDDELRRHSGAAAIDTAREYTMRAIGPRWDAMLDALSGATVARRRGQRVGSAL
jgi:glycosyltransferase involved in cell wall biosynthesis